MSIPQDGKIQFRVAGNIHAVALAIEVVDRRKAALRDRVEVAAVGGAAGDADHVAHFRLAALERVAQLVHPLTDGGNHPPAGVVLLAIIASLLLLGRTLHRLDHEAVFAGVLRVHLAERGGTASAVLMHNTLLDHVFIVRVVARHLLQERPEEGMRGARRLVCFFVVAIF